MIMNKLEFPIFNLIQQESGSIVLEETFAETYRKLIRYYVDGRETTLRKALILQGWTPPGGLTEEDLK
jgi:hypothetical protein